MIKKTFFFALLINTSYKTFSQNLLVPYRTTDGNYIYCNRETKPVLSETKYSYADFFYNGRAVIKGLNTDLYGFIDSLGKEVTPCKYKFAEGFQNNRACVTTNMNTVGYINLAGKEIILPNYKSGSSFFGGAAVVSKEDHKYFLIDSSGRLIPSSPYWEKKLQLSYDENGKKVSYFSYETRKEDTLGEIVKGLSKKKKKNATGKIKEILFTTTGEVVSPKSYDEISLNYFKTNPFLKVYSVDSSGYGLINSFGEIILPIEKYRNSNISDFKDGYAVTPNAAVSIDGMITKFNEEIIVNRYKQYLILLNENYGTYKIYDLKLQQYQKGKYANISKIVGGRFIATDSTYANIIRVNVSTQEVEDSITYTRFEDIKTRDNYDETHPSPLYSISLWDRINFILIEDTVFKNSYSILSYDFIKTGHLYSAIEQDYDLPVYDDAGTEKIERRIWLETQPPKLSEIIITPCDTLLRFSCSKPTVNDKGIYLGTYDGKHRMNYYDVLVDLQGVIRYEVVFGSNLIDTIITRDRYSKITDKFSFPHPDNSFSIAGSIQYLPAEKLFHTNMLTVEVQNTGGYSYDSNSHRLWFFYSFDLKTIYAKK